MKNNNATIEILSGSNYKRWRSDIEFVLGMMDLDMALREDEPPKLTNKSTEAMRAHYAKWERSNRLSLISIKRSIAEYLLGRILESNNAKEFLVTVANRYQTSDNAEAGHFMDELMNMSVNDLITKCVAEEEKLKRENNESAHLVALGKLNNKKRVENARKSNFHSHKKNKNFKKSGSEMQKNGNGNANNTDLKCYHYNKKGHKRVDCFKFKNWLEKKKKEQDSWWLDSGATVHVATSLQGIRNLRKPSEKESNLKVGNDIEIDVEHIGITVLELDYVLDKTGYSFAFANKRIDVIYDSKVIGNCVLFDGLYRLSLLSTCSYNVENNVAKRPLTKERYSLLWHKRLGHISKEQVERLISSGILPRFDSDDLEICVDCVKGKLTKNKKKGATHSQNLLEIVHTDISGPYSTTLCGNKYFITFIDDFSRYGYVKIYDHSLKKTDSRTTRCYFIGYPSHSKVYKFYCSTCGTRVVESQVAKFLELDVVDTRSCYCQFPHCRNKPIVDEIPPVEIRRSQRTRRPVLSNDYYVYLGEGECDIREEVDLTTYCEALSSDKANEWLIAMRDEMQSMSDNDVWELVDLPKGYKPIGCKWVFKTKRDNKGNVERYKARLVAKGYTQRKDIDFTETFSPVSTKDSFRLVMALVAHFELELHQTDVKTTFLNDDLSEEVYMSQPEGFKENGKENMVCRLKRSIYGIKQASRQWYLKFDKIVMSFGFIENKFDQCVYMKVNGSKYIFMVLYINDILLASSDVNLLNDTKRILSTNFNMKDLGEAFFVLAGDVPVVKGDKLSNEQCPKNDLEKDAIKSIPYASDISSLMYAQVCTRPDIAFIVNVLGRYLSNPGHDHWVAAKKVMRYLQRTKDFMLVYRRVDNLEVVGYSDSDFGGCSDDRKSTSRYILMLAGGAISWKSVKQSLIASSTIYAKFVACYGASSQAVWLRNLILELQVVDSIFRSIVIYCDNNAVVSYSKNNKISTGSKHMEIKYLTVKDLVKKGDIVIKDKRTESMLADPLTKGLKPIMFKEHVVNMGVIKSFDSLV
uniref:Retrovirus-related Pol polyprotein from transposon TNT 1-94 n=2 Tax=Vitis vinifera TaxID=29760 RepID=A5BHM4_VITVI|nr:hypothetical protein VITISV_033155 [Vitis vinifera]